MSGIGKKLLFAWVAASAINAASAEGASITFQNETFTTGTGIGNVPTVLVVQATPSETGAVLWDGSADLTTGDAKPQSQTWSVADLSALGIVGSDATFGLVLNLNETTPQSDVFLTMLRADFFSQSGSLLFSAPYTCVACPTPLPLNLDEAAQGTGSSGFLFHVALTPSEQALFFGTSTNRLGLAATLVSTDSGQEVFYLADLEGGGGVVTPLDPTPVPEPTSVLLLGAGLAGVVLSRVRSRRRS